MSAMADNTVRFIREDYGKTVTRNAVLIELDDSFSDGTEADCAGRLAVLVVLMGSE